MWKGSSASHSFLHQNLSVILTDHKQWSTPVGNPLTAYTEILKREFGKILAHLIEKCVTYHKSSSLPSWVNLRRWRRSKPSEYGEFLGVFPAIADSTAMKCCLGRHVVTVNGEDLVRVVSSKVRSLLTVFLFSPEEFSAGDFVHVTPKKSSFKERKHQEITS